MRRLLAYARPYVGWIVLALLLSLVFSGGRYLRAYLVKPIVDDVALPFVSSAPIAENVQWIVAAALAIVLVVPVVLFAHEYIIEVVLGRIHIDIKRDLCAKLLALPLSFHHEQRRGDVLSRAVQDVDVAHGALRLLFGDLLQSVAMIAMGVGVLVAISWRLALAVFLTLPLFVGVLAAFGRRIRRTARRRQEQYGEVTQRLIEILAGIKVIKAFRAEAHEDAAYRRETHKLFRRSLSAAKSRILARTLVEALNHAVVLGVLGFGLWMVWTGLFGLSPGDLAAFAAVLATTYRPTKFLARSWVQVADAQPAAERFLEVLDAPGEIRDAPDAVRIDGVREGVRLRGVSFSYGREPVLADVSFEARPGEMVALVGRTGAGKTTVADLLLRFHDPNAGSVEIDGVDLRRIARDSLLDQVAVVTQEPFLFDGSIRDNIRYGRPGAGEAEVLAAARGAHVDEFAGELPDGYDTEVGSGGVRLSGGQRQRITIARAILKDPAILICDEATSALDAQSERLVQDAIDALVGGRRIVIAIAHRLSTIRRADRVVVLEAGRVVLTGTHEELLRRSRSYRELVDPGGEATSGAPALR